MYLREKYGVLRAYMFIGFIPEQSDLYDMLRSWGYVLIFKPTVRNTRGLVKGNCDAELVLQVMIDFHHCHQAVIVTGDGDFACLITYLRENNKLRCLLVPDAGRYSGLLKEAARSCITDMNRLRGGLFYKKRTPVGRNREGGFSS